MEVTQQRVRQLLRYCPDSGLFFWLQPPSNRVSVGSVAGCIGTDSGYRIIMIDSRRYRAHRLAWLMVHGHWPDGQIDHINGQRADNRLANLRAVSQAENSQNIRAAMPFNTSGFLGATRRRNDRWTAQIVVDGVTHRLGAFASPQAASEAYLAAKRRLHPACTI